MCRRVETALPFLRVESISYLQNQTLPANVLDDSPSREEVLLHVQTAKTDLATGSVDRQSYEAL